MTTDPGTASAQNVPEFGFASLTQLTATSDADYAVSAAEIKNTGASWVRLGVAWNYVEAFPGVYNWSSVDPAVLAARAKGTKILLILTGPAPYWAQGKGADPNSGSATPSDPATFGRFAAATATRYKDVVSTWEIWNEPNHPRFFTSPDVARYIKLLKAAYQAIHSVQPNAVVVTGGLTPTTDAPISEIDFVDQLYRKGGRQFFDGIGMHPYTFPYGINDDPRHVWNDLEAARAIMTKKGDAAKKIWITEWGIPTGSSPYASSETQQADRLVEALETAGATPYLAPLFIFTVRDLSANQADLESNFGVYRYDGTPKESAYALQRYATGSSPTSSSTSPTTSSTSPTTSPTSTTSSVPTSSSVPTTTSLPTTTSPPTTTSVPTQPNPSELFFRVGRVLGWW
ncbi:cellulase family glycosylhydrolase [Mycobacterium sp. E740]|uniref:cellulase family glycosylhydrolase n=1 Tax=Mycobacterium sp. E740 TaxID=1834149 RepID=UPI00080180DC|nr:cellulase family glycosylhydrolase [Mycobacterium sp. E740]OBI82743.1 hypothetical protein A5663_13730 [Mycobacterium sp. E740]